MKFCKNLQRVADISDPEWAPYWTNYKMLKKLIKELPSLVPQTEESKLRARSSSPDSSDVSITTSSTIDTSGCVASLAPDANETATPHSAKSIPFDGVAIASESNGEKAITEKIALGRSPGEIAFFKLLHSEFRKVSHFFDRSQQEFTIREERVREGLLIIKRPNSIMVNEKWSTMAKSIFRLYKDLLLLETFAIMSYCSFSKILKKHDKVTGHNTRAAFMGNVVSKANFTTYPKVLEMITRCESYYEEVSERLVQEGKEGLYEDERLFINMISRLNEQTLDTPDAPERTDTHTRRPSPSVLSVAVKQNATTSSARHIPEESLATSRLRSLVEDNETRTGNVSEEQAEDESSALKRRRSLQNSIKSTDASAAAIVSVKRTKTGDQ